MNPWFTAAWLIVLGAAATLEAIAIFRRKKGDTLSELTWAMLRRSPVIWFVGIGLFLWAGVHFFTFGMDSKVIP